MGANSPTDVLRHHIDVYKRQDTCCRAVGGIQHAVQSVVGELVTADGAFIPGLPGHAADAVSYTHLILLGTGQVDVTLFCE